MADEVKQLTAELARDPDSLAFLALGEVLRARDQIEAATQIALAGLERHPQLADAHDLYARILVDADDVQRARDEWSIAVRLDARHVGALKGLGYLAFREGKLGEALDRLEEALAVDPLDPTVVQALQTVRRAAEGMEEGDAGGVETDDAPRDAPRESAAEVGGAELAGDPEVFSGLEGATDGLLLVDDRGRVLGGAVRGRDGTDAAAPVAAYLAGASQEAERTARVLGLGTWTWIVVEGENGNLHVSQPSTETLLLVRRDRSVPSGRLAVFAERATESARVWLEAQQA